jgi:tetratricopeptide (TPR) repeat protein
MNLAASTTECISAGEIHIQLQAVLADRRFISSKRNAAFLRYVVEQTLGGKAHEIKEIVIAADIYGRDDGYDPKTDSIVRVEATRVRQKLRSYYENEGRSAQIQIHLPSGTYVPRFERVRDEQPEQRSPVQDTSRQMTPMPPHDGAGVRKHSVWGLAAAGGAAVLALFLQLAPRSKPTGPRPDALAAWQEAVALFAQDPHVAQTQRGTPVPVVRAIERLEFAVAKDPRFARAWASLAEAYDYAFAYVGRNSTEDARRAEAAARRAIALDSHLGAGHHMLGLVQWTMRWDFRAAETAYRRALELEPNNVWAVAEFADLLRETGRTEEAAELIRKARALLPMIPQLGAKEAEIQLDLGRPEAAIATAGAALELRRNSLKAHVALAGAEEAKGDWGAALARYEHVLAVDPLDRRALPAYGYLLAQTGHPRRAREIAQRLEKINATIRNCAFQTAVVYAGLGENDRAFEWLERAWRTHQVHFPFAAVEHRFSGLRGDARFAGLLSRVGLTPVSLAQAPLVSGRALLNGQGLKGRMPGTLAR